VERRGIAKTMVQKSKNGILVSDTTKKGDTPITTAKNGHTFLPTYPYFPCKRDCIPPPLPPQIFPPCKEKQRRICRVGSAKKHSGRGVMISRAPAELLKKKKKTSKDEEMQTVSAWGAKKK